MATAPPDDSVLALCKYKLIRFRVTELKHVLHQLGLPKHGKKQELLDRLTSLLCVYDQQDQEKLVQTVNDTFRTMQGSTNTVAASRSPIDSGHSAKSKKETDDSPKLEAIRCPCGLRKSYAPMIKCDDPQCNVRQHVDCVIFPEQPAGNSAPEPSSSFYCEMCRISRADPFWVTVNHPLLPILIGPSIIAEDGSYMVQYTGRSFALSKANREMLQKAEYDLQVWCILLNDKVPFRMHWPLHCDLQINGSHVRVVNRQPKQKLGASGRDDGLLLTDYLQEGSNKLFLSSNDTRTFCLGIRIVKRRTLEQVLNLVPKEQDGEKFDDALARVCHCVGGGTEANNGDSDSDIEVVADSVSLNLRCPMTASKIRVAGRFKPCAHMGCFDLEAFIEINQKSRKWQCPICLKNYCLENIIIDPYFNRITSLIQNCGDETTEIDIRPDGSWRVKGGPEVKQLAQWHLPDGTLCMATDSEAPPNTGLVEHEIIEEPLSEELCRRTRSGNRKNSNGQWRVTKKGLVSSSGGGRRFENKSPATLTDPTDDVGTGDESCTREPGRNDYLISHIHDLESSPSGENVPPPSREQDVIVLSDSDDDDDIVVLSPKAVNCSSVPNPLETFGVGGEQPGGDPNGATNLPLEEGFDDLVLSFCDFPTSPQHDASYQLFGTGAQVIKKELKKYSACDQSMHEPVSVGDLGAMGVAANRLENGHDGTLKTCVSSERNVGRISSANLSDQPQTCHDLHSDNYDESLVTASQKKRSSEGRIAALDASVGWRIADDDLLEEGFDPFSPPRKRRSVRPKIDTNC